jgi:lactoylglutathione lyase
MDSFRLSLIVLRVADFERSAAFYRLLGLSFTQHAHGSEPVHYTCEADGMVFELYPSSREHPVSASTRIGFTVPDVSETVAQLAASLSARVLSQPKESKWGWRSVLTDTDGHRVELVQTGS